MLSFNCCRSKLFHTNRDEYSYCTNNLGYTSTVPKLDGMPAPPDMLSSRLSGFVRRTPHVIRPRPVSALGGALLHALCGGAACVAAAGSDPGFELRLFAPGDEFRGGVPAIVRLAARQLC